MVYVMLCETLGRKTISVFSSVLRPNQALKLTE
jgi:hypothetical protein